MQPEIISIVETWLHGDLERAFLGLKDYIIYRKDRSNGTDPHGGVLLAIKSCLNPSLVESSSDCEILAVDINQSSNKFRIISAYRPGWYDVSMNRVFFNVLGSITQDIENTCVFGDFNFPNIEWDSYTASSISENLLIQYVLENNFVKHINEPTRGTNILDLCLSSSDHVINQVCVHECFSTSDH